MWICLSHGCFLFSFSVSDKTHLCLSVKGTRCQSVTQTRGPTSRTRRTRSTSDPCKVPFLFHTMLIGFGEILLPGEKIIKSRTNFKALNYTVVFLLSHIFYVCRILLTTLGNIVNLLCYKTELFAWKTHNAAPLKTLAILLDFPETMSSTLASFCVLFHYSQWFMCRVSPLKQWNQIKVNLVSQFQSGSLKNNGAGPDFQRQETGGKTRVRFGFWATFWKA